MPSENDAAWVAMNALKQANSAKLAEFLPALRATRLGGITGKIAFGANGDLQNTAPTLYQGKGGNWVPLTTIGAECGVGGP